VARRVVFRFAWLGYSLRPLRPVGGQSHPHRGCSMLGLHAPFVEALINARCITTSNISGAARITGG